MKLLKLAKDGKNIMLVLDRNQRKLHDPRRFCGT